ncbi:MAG: hypothetical protein EPN14_09910 [Gallionella sp.]|nr:MAG: hypothetical protein EPN14_09910 [Gallionella sp.]
MDTTIKSLYGKQEGAQVGYNPHKPGRPSHALHTCRVGNLRLVPDVEVAAGLEHSARHALPGLTGVLDRLQASQRPALVRGDCGFGNDPVLEQLEEREQPYLFKLRQTKGVHRLLHRQFGRDDWTISTPADQGWQAVESTLKLAGGKRERRVVVLRRPLKQDVALAREKKSRGGKQLDLALPGEGFVAYEYAVLVTNADYGLSAIAQLYRDRADAENGFDELKNQWGWGGFTTQDLARCQSAARTVALVYNWWSWYCRAARSGARMEAQTGRPLLLAAVGRAIRHAGQSVLYLTPLHGGVEQVDHAIVVGELHHRTGHGNTALLFDFQPVRGRVATALARLHRARHLDRAAEQQQLFGERCLARIGVGDDREGAAALNLACDASRSCRWGAGENFFRLVGYGVVKL